MFFSQKGFAQIIPVLILLIGIMLGTYLVQQQTGIFSNAKERPGRIFCSADSSCREGYSCQKYSCPFLSECSSNQNNAFCIILRRACSRGVCVPNPSPTPTPQALQQFNIGLNLRGITNYGYPDLLPYSKKDMVDKDLSEAKRLGAKVVRVFVANNKIDNGEAAKRLDDFLTKAQSYQISVIPVLIDFYNSGFSPRGTEKYYTLPYNGTTLLNPQFFSAGYKEEYKGFVSEVVSKNRNHQNIYAWEVGNELKDETDSKALLAFFADMAKTIKNLDPNHKVALGMLNAAHTGLTPDYLYAALPQIDIVTAHAYSGDRQAKADLDFAKSHSKQFLVEEVGFPSSSERVSKYQTEIDYWKNAGADGVLQWGFMANGLSDNGDGDKEFGMDSAFHNDYDSLFNLFSAVNGGNFTPKPQLTP